MRLTSNKQDVIPILPDPHDLLIKTILPPYNLKDDETRTRARNLAQRPHEEVRVEVLAQAAGFAGVEGDLLERLAVGVGVDAEGAGFAAFDRARVVVYPSVSGSAWVQHLVTDAETHSNRP